MVDNGDKQEIIENAGAPDIYTDRVRSTLSTFGAALTFGIAEPHPDNPEETKVADLVTLRMSLEHLKIMLIILKNQLKKYEEANDYEIVLPKGVVEKLEINKEEW